MSWWKRLRQRHRERELALDFVENEDGKFLVLENDGIGGHLKRGDRWEPHFTTLVQSLLEPGAVAVDAGANMGCNTVTMARAVGPEGRVYAFEPQRITFQQLCANCFVNRLTNVHALPYALGDRERTDLTMAPIDYFADWVNIGDNRIGLGGEPVQVVRLDAFDLLPSFIKIDVQGYELSVLRGAKETLRRTRPLIFVEVEEPQLARQGTSSKELLDHLRSLDYKPIWIRNDYPVDHLCVPSEQPELLERALALIESEVEILG